MHDRYDEDRESTYTLTNTEILWVLIRLGKVDDVGASSRGRERIGNGHAGGRRDGRDEGGRLYVPCQLNESLVLD